MEHPLPVPKFSGGSLRLSAFDSMLILGVLCSAGLVLAMAQIAPQLLPLLVVADVWLLGYHHVIATFTKLAGTRADRIQNASLIWPLLPAVLVTTTVAALTFGVVAIVTLYFFWQWFHYVRQSWGISRRYRGPTTSGGLYRERLSEAMFWSVPVWGLLSRCYQNPDTFLWLPIWMPQVPYWLVAAFGFLAAVSTAYWVYSRVIAWRCGDFALRHTLYTASHLLVFALAYVVIEDITVGWLFVNVWHNAQYLLFVWKQNNNRFAGRRVPDSGVLPWLAQPGGARIAAYFAFCLLVSTSLYSLVVIGGMSAAEYFSAAGGPSGIKSISLAVLVSMALNFHHYIVDSIIWKRKRESKMV
jgi:hypothetical protein